MESEKLFLSHNTGHETFTEVFTLLSLQSVVWMLKIRMVIIIATVMALFQLLKRGIFFLNCKDFKKNILDFQVYQSLPLHTGYFNINDNNPSTGR